MSSGVATIGFMTASRALVLGTGRRGGGTVEEAMLLLFVVRDGAASGIEIEKVVDELGWSGSHDGGRCSSG